MSKFTVPFNTRMISVELLHGPAATVSNLCHHCDTCRNRSLTQEQYLTKIIEAEIAFNIVIM